MRVVATRALRVSLLAATALTFAPLNATAQIAQTWNGNTSTDWFTGTNWDSGTVPGVSDSVTLDTATPNLTIVDGAGGTYVGPIDLNGLNVGFLGTGRLTINNGAQFFVTNSIAVVGGDLSGIPSTSAGNGAIILDGIGTVFGANAGIPPTGAMIVVGGNGTGTFTVQNGANAGTTDSYVGHTQGAIGTVTVTGAGSQWNNFNAGGNGDNFVGNSGTGVFNVLNGGAVTVFGSTNVGFGDTGNGTINVSGAGSSWTSGSTLLGGGGLAATGGSGIINVSNGASYSAGTVIVIGFRPGGSNAFNVSSGATVTTTNNNAMVVVGYVGGTTGALTIDNATFDGSAGLNMYAGGGPGAVTGGTGIVTVRNGGTLIVQDALTLGMAGGNGTLNVSGVGSSATFNGASTGDSLFVGATGTGAMNITSGATVTTAGYAYLGYVAGSQGVVTIDGAGSTWNAMGPVTVVGGNQGSGPGGTGIVNVVNGGTWNTADAALGLDFSGKSVGTVNVSGAGSTWNAANIYVGYEAVGILNIGNGAIVNAFGDFIVGDCNCSNGTVNVSGGSTVNVAGDLYVGNSGTGMMTVSGAGTTVTVANNVFVGGLTSGILSIEGGASVRASGVAVGGAGTGPATINVTGAGSVLTVDSVMAVGIGGDNGALNILNGGRVDVTNFFASEGRITIAPGSVLNTGNFALSATATTTFGLRGASAGRVAVDSAGFAALDGALVITGRNVGRTTYTLIGSGDLVGTTFASVTYDPLLRNPVLTYTATDVLLTVDAFALTSIVPTNANANQRNVAQGIDNALATGLTPSSAFESIFFLSGSELLNALSQLSGEPGGGVQQSVMTGAGMFMGSVFDNAFGTPGVLGQGGAPLGYAAQPKVSAAAQDAYAAVTPLDRKAPSWMPSFEQRWSVWAAGYGGSTRVGGDSATGSHDTTSRVYGVTAGATWRLSPETSIGFALGGAGSNFSIAEGFGSGKSDSFNAALYARHAFGPAYVAAALGYSWQDASTDRTVSAGGVTEILHASFRPQAFTTRIEGGRRFATSFAGVTPYAALQTISLFMPSYAEAATSGTGAFALSYGSRRFTATRGELGARFDKTMMLGDRPLTLKAKAAWAHDWNNDRIASATFQQLPGATFTVNGATPAANAALLSFGADLALSRGWTISAGFDGEFSRTTASYSGKGSLRYAW